MTRMWRLIAGLALAVLATGGLGGCGPAGTGGAALPADPPTVSVSMTEYAFRYTPPSRSGRLVFRVTNDGGLDHELVMVRMADDMVQSIDAQLHSDERRPLPTVVAVVNRHPGTTTTFAVHLEPGRYAMICFVRDPGSDREHALLGMNAEFRVS